MDDWKDKFTGVLENVDGYVIGNSGGVLTIGFEYNANIDTLPYQINQGMEEIGKLADSMGADFYLVKPNDNLWNIAQSKGTTVDAIAEANKISPEEYIYPGQYLRIPGSPINPNFDTIFRSREPETVKPGLVNEYEEELSQRTGSSAIYSSTSGDVNNEFAKNAVTGGIDAVFGEQIAKVNPYKTQTIRQSLGPASEIEFLSANQVKSVKALQGISKFAGPAAAVSYGYDLYKDYNEYEGADRVKAMYYTTAGTLATIGFGVFITAFGAPVVLTVGAGAFVGAGIGYGVNYLKETQLKKKQED